MPLIIQARLIGSEDAGDPYRVDLPTYNMLDVDYANRVAVVEIPDHALPPELREMPASLRRARVVASDVTRDTAAAVRSLQRHIIATYGDEWADFDAAAVVLP